MKTPTFINGFQSWLETFFHLSTMIVDNLNENWNNNNVTTVKVEQDRGGHFALCELAKEWATEFEILHESGQWIEFEWFDTLEAFFNEKNTINN